MVARSHLYRRAANDGTRCSVFLSKARQDQIEVDNRRKRKGRADHIHCGCNIPYSRFEVPFGHHHYLSYCTMCTNRQSLSRINDNTYCRCVQRLGNLISFARQHDLAR